VIERTEIRPRSATAIDRDLACVSCSYNLRGLGGAGSCPECGTPATETLLELLSRAGAGEGTRIVPAALRQASEGAAALVFAGALMAAVCLLGEWLNEHAPAWRHESSNPFRVALLAATCVSFAAQFTGLWKLGNSEDEHGSDRALCIALRSLAAAVLVYVLLMMPATDVQHPLSLRVLGRWRGRIFPVLYVLGLAVPAMQAVLWLRIGKLARRLRCAWLNVVATIVLCTWPGAVTVLYFNDPRSIGGIGSFEATASMPVTWLWLGRWFWPIRFGEYDQSTITLAWLLITSLMVIGEIGLSVVSRRRLRNISVAPAAKEPGL
jgi:hypothetical protein